MKAHLFSIAVLAALLFAGTHAFAQVEYHEHDTIDNVLIEYRWQRERFFERDPHAILNLKVTNLSNSYIELTFTAGFYRDEQLIFETAEQSLCLEPWESKRGRRADLRFSAEGIRMGAVEEEWFSWDIPFIDVRVVDECE